MKGLLERLRSLLPKGRFARSVTVLAGGAALAQALSLTASPFLTRLYTPDNFGVLGVYASFLSLFSGIAGLRYELAIPLPEEDAEALNILVLTFFIVIFSSCLVGLGTWLFGSDIVRLANVEALEPYLWLLPLSVLMVGMYQTFNYWAVRKKTFAELAQTRLNQGLGLVTTQLGLGLFSVGPIGLILGQVVGQAAGVGTLFRSAYTEHAHLLKDVRGVTLLSEAKRYKQFPLYTTWAGFANTLSTQLPTLLFAALFSPAIAGFYMFANRILNAPLSLLGQAVGQVFHGDAAQARREGMLAPQTLQAFKQLIRLGVGPLILFTVAGPDIFRVVFGETWRIAGVYAQWLTPWLIIVFITSPLSTLVSVLEYQAQGLIFQLILLGVRVFVIVVGAALGGASLAVALYGGAGFIVWLGFTVWLMRLVGVPLKDWLFPLGRELLVLAPILLGLLALKLIAFSSFPNYASLSVVVATGVALLTIAVWRVLPAWR